MRVVVACEFSGIVRDAFIARGHDAISVDLLPTEREGPHHQGDILQFLRDDSNFDLMIAHPPCTYISNSSSQHLYLGRKKENGFDLERWNQLIQASWFFKALLNWDISKICIENPVPLGYATNIIGRTYDQKIQPWQFGHGEKKGTCFWLKNLPPLVPTNIVEGRQPRIHMMPESANRAKIRSVTYQGIADAMASQWG